jgi:hypothetical protein
MVLQLITSPSIEFSRHGDGRDRSMRVRVSEEKLSCDVGGRVYVLSDGDPSAISIADFRLMGKRERAGERREVGERTGVMRGSILVRESFLIRERRGEMGDRGSRDLGVSDSPHSVRLPFVRPIFETSP